MPELLNVITRHQKDRPLLTNHGHVETTKDTENSVVTHCAFIVLDYFVPIHLNKVHLHH